MATIIGKQTKPILKKKKSHPKKLT